VLSVDSVVLEGRPGGVKPSFIVEVDKIVELEELVEVDRGGGTKSVVVSTCWRLVVEVDSVDVNSTVSPETMLDMPRLVVVVFDVVVLALVLMEPLVVLMEPLVVVTFAVVLTVVLVVRGVTRVVRQEVVVLVNGPGQQG
jgi:hypothetical protein